MIQCLNIVWTQPRTQVSSRYPSYQTKLGTGDVTSEITEDDWEQGWSGPLFLEFNSIHAEKIVAFEEGSN